MRQLIGLWRDTKWVWLFLITFFGLMGLFLSWFFLLTLPGLPVTYCYFAFVRYDENGTEKGAY
ncbi:MAG: hypothetical protein ABJZ55_05885 [Fuerstiella sp.]